MAWRDNLRPASFRGVPFFVEQLSREQHLHADEQVFPGREDAGDAVHVEHLGAGPRRFKVDAYVVGEDYDERLAALEAALEEPGPGRLVHPYRGEIVVSVLGPISSVESSRRLGYARVSWTCVVTESPTLRRRPDTAGLVERDLDRFLDELAGDFQEQFDTDGLPDAFQQSSLDAFGEAGAMLSDAYAGVLSGLGEVRDFASDLGSTIAQVERFAAAPFDAAQALISAMTTITSIPGRVLGLGTSIVTRTGSLVGSLLTAMQPLMDFGETLAEIAGTTPNREREARLRSAVVQLVRGAALGAVARATARLAFDSRREATAVRDELVGRFDDLVDDGSASGDTVSGARLYDALATARASTAAHLSAVARTLPELMDYEVPSALPALVIAHLLYADSRREEEILARNRVATPHLIPAGAVLEVVRA